MTTHHKAGKEQLGCTIGSKVCTFHHSNCLSGQLDSEGAQAPVCYEDEMRQCLQAVCNLELQGHECWLPAAVNVYNEPTGSRSTRDRSGLKMGQDENLPLRCVGREPRKHYDPKAEEGGNFKKVGKKGRGNSCTGAKNNHSGLRTGPWNSRLEAGGDLRGL